MLRATNEDPVFCLLLPLGALPPQEMAARLAACDAGLNSLFSRVGGVHYGNLALLPAGPIDSLDSGSLPPRLLLTMSVDPGATAAEIVARLLACGHALWQRLLAGTPLAAALKTSAAVDRMLDCLSLPDGFFIGPRDRSVRQICDEAEFLDHARHLVRRVPTPSSSPDATDVAEAWRHSLRSLLRQKGLDSPAPSSRWREGVRPQWLRWASVGHYAAGAAAALALVALLALLGFTMQLSMRLFVPILEDPASFAQLAKWLEMRDVLLAILTEGNALGVGLRAVAFGCVGSMFFAWLISASRTSLRWLRVCALVLSMSALLVLILVVGVGAAIDVGDNLIRPEVSVAAAHVTWGVLFLFGVGVQITILGAAALIVLTVLPAEASRWTTGLACAWAATIALGLIHALLYDTVLVGYLHAWPGFGWMLDQKAPASALSPADVLRLATIPAHWARVDTLALLALALAASVVFAIYRLLSWVEGIPSWFPSLSQPTIAPPERGHQTHPSIDACEARWAARTGLMISLTEIKGRTRLTRTINAWGARLLLGFISSMGWRIFSEGPLGSSYSIHSAHWHVIDGGRRLLFVSNFDGDFNGYLDEFIRGFLPLANLIWRWSELRTRDGLAGGPGTMPRSFPPVRVLTFGGCLNEQNFKSFARDSMVPFQYRFAAYDRRLRTILAATALRDLTLAPASPAADDALLRILET